MQQAEWSDASIIKHYSKKTINFSNYFATMDFLFCVILCFDNNLITYQLLILKCFVQIVGRMDIVGKGRLSANSVVPTKESRNPLYGTSHNKRTTKTCIKRNFYNCTYAWINIQMRTKWETCQVYKKCLVRRYCICTYTLLTQSVTLKMTF